MLLGIHLIAQHPHQTDESSDRASDLGVDVVGIERQKRDTRPRADVAAYEENCTD